MRQIGAVPSQIIEQLISNHNITAAQSIPTDNIQPASLDLRLGTQGWQVQASFLPLAQEPISQAVQRCALESLNLSSPVVLQVDHTYVIEIAEHFALPKSVHAYTNNKSTTGRMNIWARTLADGLPRFDKIPAGYTGTVYVMVTPRSWPIKICAGSTLNQARFLTGDNHLLDLELEIAHQRYGLVYGPDGRPVQPLIDNGLLLTVDLHQDIVGYRAIKCSTPVDLTNPQCQSGREYFEAINSRNGEILLKKNEFYILCTKEYLRVPPDYAVEMVAYDIHSGEYRSHYAGFFDPGFGFGLSGDILGTPAVLEVDTHENVLFRHGQPICKMVYEHMLKPPERVYGQTLGSHYQNQRGPQLGRHFTNDF